MKSQIEIFVNRMKSNSSRGRSISNDSSVQTLFMNLTSLHSRLLTYIKEMDDKRMWYEQLQDKLAQVRNLKIDFKNYFEIFEYLGERLSGSTRCTTSRTY